MISFKGRPVGNFCHMFHIIPEPFSKLKTYLPVFIDRIIGALVCNHQRKMQTNTSPW